MSKFKVGDIITGTEESNKKYSITNSNIKMVVKQIRSHGEILVQDISDGRDFPTEFTVSSHYFKLAEEGHTKKGARYNEGKLRWRNVPMFILRPVVEVGAAAEKIEGNPTGKYPTYNFLKGLSVADCIDSLKRHLDEVDDPTRPDLDLEDGKHHLAKIAWNALVALHHINTNPDLDDRYKGEENE